MIVRISQNRMLNMAAICMIGIVTVKAIAEDKDPNAPDKFAIVATDSIADMHAATIGEVAAPSPNRVTLLESEDKELVVLTFNYLESAVEVERPQFDLTIISDSLDKPERIAQIKEKFREVNKCDCDDCRRRATERYQMDGTGTVPPPRTGNATLDSLLQEILANGDVTASQGLPFGIPITKPTNRA